MSPLTDNENEEFYRVSVPVTPYDHIIFARMNGSANPSKYSWDDRWNQTSDLTFDGNCYTITGWNASDGGRSNI